MKITAFETELESKCQACVSLSNVINNQAFTLRKAVHHHVPSLPANGSGEAEDASPQTSALTIRQPAKRCRSPEAIENSVVDLNSEGWKRRQLAVVDQKGPSSANESLETPKCKWKASKVLVGHQGWVFAAAVDPTNSWFATGGFDTIIKVWDLASGTLKLNLTGHKEAVRALVLSKSSPYMFSASDDHSIKCWDLERNEVVREFFGHRSAVHSLSAHPTLDVIVSGGRDSTVRVWDIRTRKAVHTLLGHRESVMSVVTRPYDPQVISGGNDGFIFLWDLTAGKAYKRLTRHKKPVRGLCVSPSDSTLISCGADDIRVWSLPAGEHECQAGTSIPTKDSHSQTQYSYLWSSCAMSARGTFVAGSQDGHLAFYDWSKQPDIITNGERKVFPFYRTMTKSIPGTLKGEGGINFMTFDASGTRLITAESDKSVKVWQMKERAP